MVYAEINWHKQDLNAPFIDGRVGSGGRGEVNGVFFVEHWRKSCQRAWLDAREI